jgi:photosystem II stability/assembly factor-like uncharacterized protein
MKRKLLSIAAVLTVGSVFSQTPSPSWTISQNASFTVPAAGTRYLDAVDANVVWLAGYDGFAPNLNVGWYSRTIDGGNSYTSGSIFNDTNSYVLSNMEGIDANTAWVSAYTKSISAQGGIFRTTNGGTTWTNMTAPGMYANPASFCNVVSFLTPSVGITMGDPVNNVFEIWRTTDGGNTWTQVPGANIPAPLAGEFGIVDYYGKQGSTNLWFGTNQGRVYRTNDAGLTWSVSVVTPPGGVVTQFAFTTPMNGIIFAVPSGGQGNNPNVYNTTNGGATWNLIGPLSSINNLGRNDICAIPGTNFYASVDNQNARISYSKNGGLTWTDWGSTQIPYLKIDFVNNFTAWAGSFSDFNNASIGGIWKYNGITFNSSFSVPQNVCLTSPNTTVSPVNNSGGTGNLTYSWSASPAGVAFSSSSATVPVITFSTIGTYTISLDVTNSNGTNSSSQVVNVLSCSAPTASFSVPASACTNYSFMANNSSSGSPSPTFEWSIAPAANTTITSGTSTNPAVSIGAAGVYTITLVATNPSGSVQTTQTVNVATCAPIIGFSVPAVVCVPAKTVSAVNSSTNPAGASGSITYTWSISPAANITFNQFGFNTVFNLGGGLDTTVASYTVKLTAKNASGTSTITQTFMVDPCGVGVNENNMLASKIQLFPNPAAEVINLVLPSNTVSNVKLLNVLGTVIAQNNDFKGEKISFNLSKLPAGVYFITVESGNEKVTKKIIHD